MEKTLQKNVAICVDVVSLAEEIDAIAVESVYIARQALLEGKLRIGLLISENSIGGVTALVQQLAQRSKLSERELYYCYQFHVKQDELETAPDYQSKNVSWNKIKKMMSSGRDLTRACEHNHVKKITICEDCGSRI